MRLELKRLFLAGGARVGTLSFVEWSERGVAIEDQLHTPECWTLEPELAIAPGSYELKLRRYGAKYDKFRARYPWNEPGMLELVGVPERTDILIHPGNTKDDTLGCILLGLGAFAYGVLAESVEAYQHVYARISDELLRVRGSVWLDIKGENT
jgi:hypothetical protein